MNNIGMRYPVSRYNLFRQNRLYSDTLISMKDYSLKERANFYKKRFPDWPAPRTDERWLDGIWVLGQNYRGSGYYGAYPPNYLVRVMSMFPDAENVLHLFSGSLLQGKYDRLDIKGDVEIKGEASNLSQLVNKNYDLILSDPPYSNEDALHYGTPMISRNIVVKECEKILEPNGFLLWLDQVLPMFRKDSLHLCGLIGIVRSTNHRFRVLSIFKKLYNPQGMIGSDVK